MLSSVFFPSQPLSRHQKQRWKETGLIQSTSFHYLKLPQ
ncbi:rCG38086 [Rattus norvegicus]|uniref:RCG38086 n=1 Tax=Rattus norvegicus TaxID=10116 RepID=A6IV30_RAT|nr:rCG38086 [Rattus norvegicus]